MVTQPRKRGPTLAPRAGVVRSAAGPPAIQRHPASGHRLGCQEADAGPGWHGREVTVGPLAPEGSRLSRPGCCPVRSMPFRPWCARRRDRKVGSDRVSASRSPVHCWSPCRRFRPTPVTAPSPLPLVRSPRQNATRRPAAPASQTDFETRLWTSTRAGGPRPMWPRTWESRNRLSSGC